MSKKEYLAYKKPYLLFPLSIAFLLVIGIAISLIQLRQQQSTKTEADVAIQNCTVSSDNLTISTAEQELFDKINEFRDQNGLAALTWSEPLTRAASWMSNDMITTTNLSHTDSLSRDAATRITQCGNAANAAIGENVDSGTIDPTALLAAWQHAPSQKANLLNPAFTMVGIALSTSTDNSQAYWTLNLSGSEPTSAPTASPTAMLTSALSPTSPAVTTNPSTTKAPSPTSGSIPTLAPTVKPTKAPTSTPTPTRNLTPSPTRVPTKPFKPSPTPKPSATPVPTIDPNFVKNPLDTQMSVGIEMPGIGDVGNRSPKNLSRKIQVDLYDLENKLVTSGYGFLQYDKNQYFRGLIHFGEIPNGTYYAKILHPFALSSVVLPQFQTISNERLNILPNVTLTTGDLDEDNSVTIDDYNLALSCFQDKACEEVKEQIDFNDDGTTNVTDYNILLQNYWRTYGD